MTTGTYPALPYYAWRDTLNTLHMWTQIVGKVKLELVPFINQWWEVAFYITATGLTTGPMPYRDLAFAVDLNFLDHTLAVRTSTGKRMVIPLKACTVADFYDEFMGALGNLGIQVAIWPVPVEVPNPIPFREDITHATYDPAWANRWWQVMLQSRFIFDRFRSSFGGKNSPHQFFWGTFDLSGTRFSGRPADPPKPEGVLRRIMRYAENAENFAYGFWPGDERYPQPAYYVYMHPKPPGFETINVDERASYNDALGEYVYPYEAVRQAATPAGALLRFLQSLYLEGTKRAGWDIRSLESRIPPNLS